MDSKLSPYFWPRRVEAEVAARHSLELFETYAGTDDPDVGGPPGRPPRRRELSASLSRYGGRGSWLADFEAPGKSTSNWFSASFHPSEWSSPARQSGPQRSG